MKNDIQKHLDTGIVLPRDAGGIAKHGGRTHPDRPDCYAPDPKERERIQVALRFFEGVRNGLHDIGSVDHQDVTIGSPGSADTKPAGTIPNNTGGAGKQFQRPLPQQVGKYKIERLLGEGGFAAVFKAHDPDLNRSVALKVLKPALIHHDAGARFQREAKAVALLSHPNLIPIFETGTAGNVHYIASEYCHAITLDHWLKQNEQPVDLRTAAAIISTLADAIDHAHRRGVIHRDLKPSNILIELDENGNVPDNIPELTAGLRITDFGLALHDDHDDNLQTTEGAIVGTPAFMSPEQAGGYSEITAVSDIYSLGVILYVLIAGRLPIKGSTHMETILEIGTTEPTDPRKLNRAIGRDLEAVCLKALAKPAARRYQTAFAFSRDLEDWLGGRPVRAKKTSRLEKLGKWCHRNPVLTCAIAGMAAGLIVATTQWRRAVAQTQIAQSESARAEKSIDLSQEVIRGLATDISRSSSIPPEVRHKLLARAVNLQELLLKQAPDDKEIQKSTAEAYFFAATSLHDMRKFAESNETLEKSIRLMQGHDHRRAEVILDMGLQLKINNLVLLNRPEEALKIARMNPNLDDDVGVVVKGNVHDALQQHEEAILAFHGEIAQLEKACEKPDNVFSVGTLAIRYRMLSDCELALEKWDDAYDSSCKGIGIWENLDSSIPYHESFVEEYARALDNRAEVEIERGNVKAAMKDIEAALSHFRSLCKSNKLVPRYKAQRMGAELAKIRILTQTGQLDQAVSLLEDLEPEIAAFDERSVFNLNSYEDELACRHYDIGVHFAGEDPKRALTHLEKGIAFEKIAAEIAPDDHGDATIDQMRGILSAALRSAGLEPDGLEPEFDIVSGDADTDD